MKAMILAAGRGERLRPLTDTLPKPLLPVGGKPLIVWHLERLAAAGWREVIINHAHLGQVLEATLGNGRTYGLQITYSPEPPGALETAGGIAAALPLLGERPFLVVNGDIWCDWNVARAYPMATTLGKYEAHLVLVDNPPHHPRGDFCLQGSDVCRATEGSPHTLTYAGIGIFRPSFFGDIAPRTIMKLRPLLEAGMARAVIRGERHAGRWVDVGTAARLAQLDQELTPR